MAVLNLKQGGNIDFDLTADGVTDTYNMDVNPEGLDLQIIRSPTANVGQPLITLQISNDNTNWDDWEIEGFIFKDLNNMFIISRPKRTFFRISWLSNSSTGTFQANFNIE
jgi:hypothetical protein